MALCISLVPKNLLPVDGGVVEEEVYGFDGIIPTIEKYGNKWDLYVPYDFKTEFEKCIKQLQNANRS
jgi:hypothetical protein